MSKRISNPTTTTPDASTENLQNAASIDSNKNVLVHEIVDSRWEVCCAASDGQFQQVSFVNSINTYKGGTHVNYVTDQIVAQLIEAVKKKSGKQSVAIKPFQVKNHMFVFINCLIENPSFDSQTKENMTLKQSAFGSKCTIGEDFVKTVVQDLGSWRPF